jgi:WD40 repeat protein
LRLSAIVIGVLVLFTLAPYWYTQLLPRPYLSVLTSQTVDIETALSAYENLRSFPGYGDTADSLFRGFVEQRARVADSDEEIDAVVQVTTELPDAGRLPDVLRASYWERQAYAALREERRDDALIATLKSLALPTSWRRQRAASLIADDYPMLLASLPPQRGSTTVFDQAGLILTSAEGARISQWTYTNQALQQRESWSVTALEVVPLVRRVVVDRKGIVNRIGLTLNISHARLADLRIKIIAPSGRTVEIEPGMERASNNDDIRIGPEQLRELIGESLSGTWSISLRDESIGVAGQLVGWNLKLNSQGAVEDFQRGLNIPDPVERETDNIWFDKSGRFAVARAMQSDSARIWDLSFGEPVRAVPLTENESLIGLGAGARRLITATQDSINLWDTATGDRVKSLPVGAASASAVLTDDGRHLFVEHRGDTETRLELWSLEQGLVTADLVVAGVPSLVEVDPTGMRVAVADYDRAVRVWDFASGELIAQVDLRVQPSAIHLAPGGEVLGVVHGQAGVSLWNTSAPQSPLLEDFATGDWQFVFSSSGASALAGRPTAGFQTYRSRDGRLVGPPIGVSNVLSRETMLAFSEDEKLIFTGIPNGISRFWRAAEIPPAAEADDVVDGHLLWQPSADRVTALLPGAQAIVIGDPSGHVHIMPADAGLAEVQAMREDVSFVGHNAEVLQLAVDRGGKFVASAAADNSIRVWDTSSGQPLPYVAEIEGDVVTRLIFSPDASLLAVLKGTSLTLLNVVDGEVVAEFTFVELSRGLAFARDDRIYFGDEAGALRQIVRDGDSAWSTQQIWQGTKPIRHLEANERGDILILVDNMNQASQFVLAEMRIGEEALILPNLVEEVTFSRSGAHIYVRTPRWTHKVSLSVNGPHWVDAVFSPKPLNGAEIVFGAAETEDAYRAYLPTARNGFLELVELPFPRSTQPGLFGRKDDLLSNWQSRLGYANLPTSTD